MKIRVVKNFVQTGNHYGKKGQEFNVPADLPEPVARQWLAMKAAEEVKDAKKPAAGA